VLPGDYYYHSQKGGYRRSVCIKCDQKYKKRHPQPVIYGLRRNWRKIGLDADFVEAYWNNHKVCEICGRKEKISLSADHCHKTNTFRGMLCGSCNLGIGKFQDDPILLDKAIQYLNRVKPS